MFTHHALANSSFHYVEINFEIWSLKFRGRKSVDRILFFHLTASLILYQIFFQNQIYRDQGIQHSSLSKH